MIKLQRQFMKLAVLKNINPFGLRHGSYNETVSTVTLTAETTTGRGNGQGRGGGGAGNGNGNASGNSGSVILQQIDPEEQKYKYKYNGKEWQDELGLNWDSFKYRNYNYAIGLGTMHSHPVEKDILGSMYGDLGVGQRYHKTNGINKPYLIYFPKFKNRKSFVRRIITTRDKDLYFSRRTKRNERFKIF